MLKGSKLQFEGKTYHLLFNGAALFAAQDIFTETDAEGKRKDRELDDIIFHGTLPDLCTITCIMAEQGELTRRHYGYAPQEMLEAGSIMINASPRDALEIRNAAAEAYFSGWNRETQDENEEIDLGLQELQKKTETA